MKRCGVCGNKVDEKHFSLCAECVSTYSHFLGVKESMEFIKAAADLVSSLPTMEELEEVMNNNAELHKMIIDGMNWETLLRIMKKKEKA